MTHLSLSVIHSWDADTFISRNVTSALSPRMSGYRLRRVSRRWKMKMLERSASLRIH